MEERFIQAKLRPIAWETQIQEALELCSHQTATKKGEAYKGKNHKVTEVVCQEVGLESARSKNVGWARLVGIQNSCPVSGKDLETRRLQLAAAGKYCFENDCWYPWLWHNSENSSSQWCRNTSENTSTRPPSSILDDKTPVTPFNF